MSSFLMSALNTGGSINTELYHDLIHYFKYASSAYSPVCPRPNGKKLIMPFYNISGDIQGYVARDDDRHEVIVAFRGSVSILTWISDASLILVPFIASGAKAPSGVRVHSGFLLSWNSVQIIVRIIISQQMESHSNYAIVTSGHSLGGALALFCAIVLKQHYPNTTVRTYSYGAPRAGNENFATFVNDMFRENAHRVVHADDGVPTLIPTHWDIITMVSSTGSIQILPQKKPPVHVILKERIRDVLRAYQREGLILLIGHISGSHVSRLSVHEAVQHRGGS